MPPRAPVLESSGPFSRLKDHLRSFERGEIVVQLRQATMLAKDVTPAITIPSGAEDIAVLVHGFLATAGVLRPLRERLDADGSIGTASFSHWPGEGVVRIAETLGRLVEELTLLPLSEPGKKARRIHLVGHSLGGIAARWYVQELGGADRVHQTISIASPFGGARVASLLPFAVGADLHRDSEILRSLRDGAPHSTTPHTSLIAEADTTGFNVDGAAWSHGALHRLRGLGHNGILYDREALELVSQLIRPGLQGPPRDPIL